jgi:hypothetical protein
MIDREEEMILEDGDHFQVNWTEEDKQVRSFTDKHGFYEKTYSKNFIFQKHKDDFVLELLKNDEVTTIEVGTFLKIK